MRRTAIVAPLVAGIVGVGGFAWGATTSTPSATICATARNVPALAYPRASKCPRGDHAIQWATSAPSIVTLTNSATPVAIDASGATEAASCPSGYAPTGGGYDAGVASISPPSPGPPSPSPVDVTASHPTSTGWEVVYSSGTDPADLLVYVICESP